MSPEPADSPLPAERFDALLEERSSALAIEVADARPALAAYLAELDLWRRRMNLTGQLSAVELADHALESLVANDLIAHGERVVDIGSGAGFPGLPVAIFRRDLEVSLVEPRGKRAAFLRHVIRVLSLDRVVVLEKRVEEVGGQTFGAATSRAVGRPSTMIDAAPFLRSGGVFLLWTTLDADRDLVSSSWKVERIVPIPGSERRTVKAYRKLA